MTMIERTRFGSWLTSLWRNRGRRALPLDLQPDGPLEAAPAPAPAAGRASAGHAPAARAGETGLLARRRFVDEGEWYLAELEAAGCGPADVSVLVMRQAVIIEARCRSVRRVEGNVGRLEATTPQARRRQLALPDPIALESHEAVLEDGVLRLKLMKEAAPPLWARALPVRRATRER